MNSVGRTAYGKGAPKYIDISRKSILPFVTLIAAKEDVSDYLINCHHLYDCEDLADNFKLCLAWAPCDGVKELMGYYYKGHIDELKSNSDIDNLLQSDGTPEQLEYIIELNREKQERENSSPPSLRKVDSLGSDPSDNLAKVMDDQQSRSTIKWVRGGVASGGFSGGIVVLVLALAFPHAISIIATPYLIASAIAIVLSGIAIGSGLGFAGKEIAGSADEISPLRRTSIFNESSNSIQSQNQAEEEPLAEENLSESGIFSSEPTTI